MSLRSFQRVFQGAAIIALFSNPLFLLANPVPSLVKQDWGDFSIFHPSMRSVTSVNSNEGSGVEDVELDDPKLSSNVAWAPCQGDFPVKGKVAALREFGNKRPEVAADPVFQLVDHLFQVAPGVLTEHGKTKNPFPNVDAASGCLLHHYGMVEFEYYTVLLDARGQWVLSVNWFGTEFTTYLLNDQSH
ncbi:hypothetical protein PPACK8108_LOCUS13060 [Phakopsora pachyrhizi]|uniref:Uncharacterized protein n=1 Tax=Phakopsora pachyrhizi TaxID=170000 RepID=A0AAV0B4Z7_PHAPC|nr:hypothetical protein PPACK8108_LOCUS13060 [Phakopsora pachyrhizi]